MIFNGQLTYALRDEVSTVGFQSVTRENVNRQNRSGMLPIHVAIQAGAVDELKALLAMGADPGAQSSHGFNYRHYAGIMESERRDGKSIAANIEALMQEALAAWGYATEADSGTGRVIPEDGHYPQLMRRSVFGGGTGRYVLKRTYPG